MYVSYFLLNYVNGFRKNILFFKFDFFHLILSFRIDVNVYKLIYYSSSFLKTAIFHSIK